MVVQVSERKPGNDDDREPSFESKYMIQTGNYVKFGLTVDTIFRNVRVDKLFKKRSPSLSLTKNDAFYEIINKKKETTTTTTSENTMDDSDQLLHEEDRLSMWIDSKDLYCSCPKIRLRRKYLVMSKASNLLKYLNAIRQQQQEENDVADNGDDLDNDDQEDDIQFSYDDRHGSSNSTSSNSTTSRIDVRRAATAAVDSSSSQSERARRLAGLLVDRDTSIVEWRPNYARRLRRFIRYYQSGKCS